MNIFYLIRRILEEEKPIKFLLSRILWKTGLCILFRIKYGLAHLYFFKSALSASLWYNNNDRSEDLKVLMKTLKEGDLFIDIGANIGSLACNAMKIVGDKGKVICFEPHPKVYKHLLKNIKLNSNGCEVIALNKAVSNKSKVGYLSDSKMDDQNTISDSGIQIEMVTSEDILSYGIIDRAINLLKIDVEGHEMDVLMGIESLLPQVENLYIEVDSLNSQQFVEFIRKYFKHLRILSICKDSGKVDYFLSNLN
jgi:FkbM family methyltransferase